MASVTLSDRAPQEDFSFSLGQAVFDLGPGDSYETEDRAVISDAQVHPWLDVEVDVAEVTPNFADDGVTFADDVLAAQNSHAFDPVEEHEEDEDEPVAFDAGLDQSKNIFTGGIAQTWAADAAQDDHSEEEK